ncbi:hypothetical protein GALL_95880 [mine drainage metagenome]|uniref:Polysaccharide lyase n=1 Tax=mine drainage metagenome TaxID=410659 RepID=A0A1J5SHY6_9ZZZZ
MSPRLVTSLLSFSLLAIAGVSVAHAQYPYVSDDIKAEARDLQAGWTLHSDQAFAKAMPEIRAWEAKGKPYIPGAAKPSDLPQAKIPAFPGAWGGGMYSFGGRGGRVFEVTNLNDDGPGSFRAACEAGGPRIVVFNVAGIIRLKSPLYIRAPYITIAGNTAPGDGVCIAGNTVEVNTHDVIIRYMRFRRGATWVGNRDDALGGNPVGNIIVDHVSASWGLDENLSMYRHMYAPPGSSRELKLPTVNITIQNSISSEGLNIYHHAFGSTIGGHNSTFIDNLWACNTGRNPSVGMDGDFTFANNVLFNWVHRSVDGGDQNSRFNIIANTFKPGPATLHSEVRHRLLKPESERSHTVFDRFGKAYVAGNVVTDDPAVTANNWNGGVQPVPRVESRTAALAAIRVDTPWPHAPFPLMSAARSYAYVLANAGDTLPHRDAVDTRIINDVRNGTASAKPGPDIAASLSHVRYSTKTIQGIIALVPKGIITDPSQVGGYPVYKGTPYVDSDHDGMPDAWEIAHGLNPHDPSDASQDLNGDGYTNIEDYINGLDPRAPKVDWTDLRNNVDPRAIQPQS